MGLKSVSDVSVPRAQVTDNQAEPGLGAGGVHRVRVVGVAIACVIFLVLALIDLGRPREQVFDFYQRLLPRQVDATPAIVVEIDDESLAEIGPWPWPRTFLAELTHKLGKLGPRVIGFDMIFPEEDRYGPARLARIYRDRHPDLAERLRALPDPDEIFADAISLTPVVLSRAGVGADEHVSTVQPDDLMVFAEFSDVSPSKVISFPGVVGNIGALEAAAEGIASINGPKDDDGVIRRLPTVVRIGDQLTPALSVELLRVAESVDGITINAENDGIGSISIGPHDVVTQSDGRFRPYFSQSIPERRLSASDVLFERVPPDALKDKIVIVGLASLGVRDLVATPVIGSTYGSDLHAQAVEIILSGAWLKRPGSMASVEFSLAVALAFLAIWLLPMRTPNRGVVWVAGGVLFVVAVSLGAFVGGRVLVDLIVPFLGGGGTAIGCLGALLVETDRHRRDLRETLAEARVREAKIDGELAAAKDIQLGMLPDTAAIASLPRHVDLSAFLEPARSIGGDLYDAFMLDDRRLYFMVGDVTGKGVPASLFMALAKALSKSVVLREGSDLEEAVMAANAEISRENTAEFFVTALFGVLDTTTGEVELCNAGHDNPLILRADGSIEVFEMDGGPPLCVFEEFPYPVEPITLAPGETLVIITDGVTEAKAPDDDLFGRERLLEVLGAERSGEIIDEVVSAVRAFEAGADPTDDLTVMTITFRSEDG